MDIAVNVSIVCLTEFNDNSLDEALEAPDEADFWYEQLAYYLA